MRLWSQIGSIATRMSGGWTREELKSLEFLFAAFGGRDLRFGHCGGFVSEFFA
jgi:hypothetical protein